MNIKDFDNHTIAFFADKGETEIYTDIETFSFKHKIIGSEQQKLFESYQNMMKKFQNKNLLLIKEEFEARKQNDNEALTQIFEKSNKLLKQQYAFSINFALMNKDSEVAPYITVHEIPDTSIKFLDSIYSNLSDRIKTSSYGLLLEEHIKSVKNKPTL